MNGATYVKRYTDLTRGVAATVHLRWLASLQSGVRLPAQHPGTASHVVLERLSGCPVLAADLPAVAAALGRIHGVAYRRELHRARLDRPFATASGLTIPEFPAGRRRALTAVPITIAERPAALYKDANLRNVVMTDTGPALVDFDDLTLAPFGYDLAKLIVSLAMTHGPLNPAAIAAALLAYNAAAEDAGAPPEPCTETDLRQYTNVHDLLTSRYLHRNGYRHAWRDVQPWPPRHPSAKESHQ